MSRRVSHADIDMVINRAGNPRTVSRMDLALDLRDAYAEIDRLTADEETAEEKETWWRRRSEMDPRRMGTWQ